MISALRRLGAWAFKRIGYSMAAPDIFSAIIGQTEAIEILSRFLGRQEVPTSFLFYGPEGTGKSMTAAAFASELVRRAMPEKSNLLSLPPASVLHDLTVLDKGRDRIKIDEIQDLIMRMNLKPYQSGRKAVVINNAENLTKEAANCLLKTLEEPPAVTHIVLVTRNLNVILPTIRSRCIKVRFHRLSEETIERLLVEKQGLEAEAARQISLLSEGSMANALQLADKEAYAELRKLFDSAVKLWEQGPKASARGIMDLASEFDKPEEREKLLFTKLLDILYLYWRDVMASSLGVPGVRTVLGLPRYISATAGQAQRALNLIASVRDDLANNVNLRIALEYVLLETGRLLAAPGEPHAPLGRN